MLNPTRRTGSTLADARDCEAEPPPARGALDPGDVPGSPQARHRGEESVELAVMHMLVLATP